MEGGRKWDGGREEVGGREGEGGRKWEGGREEERTGEEGFQQSDDLITSTKKSSTFNTSRNLRERRHTPGKESRVDLYPR